MLRVPTKPYTDNQIEYYSYINYNFDNGYLLEEDNLLESIDASLPTGKELVEQRKRYNKKMKELKDKMITNVEEIYDERLIEVMDKDGSTTYWDRDTYEMMKERFNVREL